MKKKRKHLKKQREVDKLSNMQRWIKIVNEGVWIPPQIRWIAVLLYVFCFVAAVKMNFPLQKKE